jgi:hypothetical protein
VLSSVFRGTQFYSDVQRIVDVARQNAVMYYLERAWQRVVGSSERNVTTANSTELELVRRFIRDHKRQIAIFHVYATEPFLFSDARHSSSFSSRVNDSSFSNQSSIVGDNSTDSVMRGRRLFSVQQEGASGKVVDSYTSLVASTRGFSNIAVSSMSAARGGDQSIPLVTDTWLEGPFGWPPRYDFYGADAVREGKCAAFEVGMRSTADVFRWDNEYFAVISALVISYLFSLVIWYMHIAHTFWQSSALSVLMRVCLRTFLQRRQEVLRDGLCQQDQAGAVGPQVEHPHLAQQLQEVVFNKLLQLSGW